MYYTELRHVDQCLISVLHRSNMECFAPFQKQHEITGKYYDFPCGKCPNCLKSRVSGWSFRLMKHEQANKSAHFITLTYDTDHVPITPNGFMTLAKRDIQLFMKRLRKMSPKSSVLDKISYYACGEYGGKTNRPHYHLIMYNVDVLKVEKAWNLGAIHVGDVTGASVGYTLKYMMKEGKIPMHANDDRIKEFQLVSKGIGINYLTPQMQNWHKADLENRMYVPLTDGKKIRMPRYYKNKIYNEEERERIASHLKMVKRHYDHDHPKTELEKYNEFEAAINNLKKSRIKENQNL